jgi:DNA-directed RNA polymerase subunit M/transcription elongation factor TFIIS
MARRGQCRCGSVLSFQKGPDGYKTRCPSCGSVVRLRPQSSKKRVKQKSARRGRPPGDVQAANRPASQFGPRAGRAVTCEVCHTLVPVEATQCPGCGSALALTTAAPILADRRPSSLRATVPKWPKILGWLTASAALIAVAAIVLMLSLRH